MKKLAISLIAVAAVVSSAMGAGFTDEEKSSSYSAKEVEVMPVPVKQSQPHVPRALKGVAGKVFVGFIVAPSGSVKDPRILKSENDSLNKIAMDCVKDWSFKAAEKGGEKVAMRVIVPLRFG